MSERGANAPARPGEGGWRPIVPAPVLDAGISIALGVAILGASSGLGARAQREHLPAAAIVVLAAMGLILFWRRRFPGTVLAIMAVLVALLAVMSTSLEGAFIAVLIASYLGTALGLGLGAALADAFTHAQQATVVIPGRQLVSYIVATAIAGVLAAIVPARRAARLNVLDAIAAE